MLEVGKTYITRQGDAVTIESYNPETGDMYHMDFLGNTGFWYTKDGEADPGDSSPHDITGYADDLRITALENRLIEVEQLLEELKAERYMDLCSGKDVRLLGLKTRNLDWLK